MGCAISTATCSTAWTTVREPWATACSWLAPWWNSVFRRSRRARTRAPRPHARAEYAPAPVALERLAEVQGALDREEIPLRLAPNAENHLFEEGFLPALGTPKARLVGRGPYVLVELPYTAPVPTLLDL